MYILTPYSEGQISKVDAFGNATEVITKKLMGFNNVRLVSVMKKPKHNLLVIKQEGGEEAQEISKTKNWEELFPK